MPGQHTVPSRCSKTLTELSLRDLELANKIIIIMMMMFGVRTEET